MPPPWFLSQRLPGLPSLLLTMQCLDQLFPLQRGLGNHNSHGIPFLIPLFPPTGVSLIFSTLSIYLSVVVCCMPSLII